MVMKFKRYDLNAVPMCSLTSMPSSSTVPYALFSQYFASRHEQGAMPASQPSHSLGLHAGHTQEVLCV